MDYPEDPVMASLYGFAHGERGEFNSELVGVVLPDGLALRVEEGHITELQERNWIEMDDDGDGITVTVTERGRYWLRRYCRKFGAKI